MEKSGFNSAWIRELKNNLNIVTVVSKYCKLDRKGKLFWTCCPFHMEKTPSFAVNEIEQFFKCFGCGVSGDVINFVQKIEATDFYDTCKILAEQCGMEMPKFENDNSIALEKKKKDTYLNILRDAARYYYSNLKKDQSKVAIEYLKSRKLDAVTVRDFGIGYSLGWNDLITYLSSLGYSKEDMIAAGVAEQKNNVVYDTQAKRLIFPIINSYNEVIGFSARILEKSDFAKYKNTAQTLIFDKSKTVYNINNIKKLRNTEGLKEIIIVEGQMDVIALYKSGFKNAVACMGTALTQYHAKELKRFSDKVIVCFDGDGAGIKATLRSLDILVSSGLNVFVASLPDGMDPDEYINKYGKESFANFLNSSKYWVEFLIKYYSSKYDLQKLEEKTKFVAECLGVINNLSSESEKDIYLDKIKQITNISLSVLKEDLKNIENGVIVSNVNDDKNKEESVNLKENAYVKAVKFVIAALLYKKPYATLNINIKENLKNSDYLKIYEYIEEQSNNGNIPKISSIFDMFNVEDNSDVYDVVNFEFIKAEDNEKYFQDCAKTLISYGLMSKQDELSRKLKEAIDNDERLKIAKEIQDLIMKRKGL